MGYEVDLTRALIDPSAVFKTPQDVLKCSLSKADKIRILKAWEYDLYLMQTADEENMPGNDSHFLQEIQALLRALTSPPVKKA